MNFEFYEWLSQFHKPHREIENTKTNEVYYVAWNVIHKNDSRIPYCHYWFWVNNLSL